MSNRLDTLVSFVDQNKVVCDVGTDHGITAIKIYEEKNPKKVIATDISENSLKKLKDKLVDLDYDITCLVTDGIYDLEDYALEEIIISGMGGYLISQIIEKGDKVARKAHKLILQANNSLSHLRHFLLENSYEILDEKIALDDGIYYDVIVAKSSDQAQESYEKDYFYTYGKLIIEKKNPLLREKLEKEKETLTSIKKNIEAINTDSSKKRIEEINLEIETINEVLACL